MKMLFDNVDSDREGWLKAREGKIGSSEIGTVCLMNEWQTPFELWAEKTGKVPRREETEAMWLGKELEPTVGRMFARRTGLPVKAANCLVQHDSVDWATASPDFWVTIGDALTVLEAKFAKGRNWRFWEDGPPKSYILQLNWQLGIAGLGVGFIARLIGGDPDNYGHHEFEFSKELFDFCMERATDFERCLREDIPPLAGEGDSKLIAQLQGAREKVRVNLEDAAISEANAYEALADELSAANELVKKKKSQLDKHKGRLLQLIGNAEEGLLPDGRVVMAVARSRKAYPMPAANWVEMKINNGKGE